MNLSENISKINKLESEYNILGVESIRDKIISQYGKMFIEEYIKKIRMIEL